MDQTGLANEDGRDWIPEIRLLLRYILKMHAPIEREADWAEAAAHANQTGSAGLSTAERDHHCRAQQARRGIGADHREDE